MQNFTIKRYLRRHKEVNKMTEGIGLKVKKLRISKNYTLKQLSEESGLSAGYLSQFERGLSSIAIDSLEKLANILGVSLSSFFGNTPSELTSPLVHPFDLLPNQISPQIYQYLLNPKKSDFDMLSRIFLLMPFSEENAVPERYCHEGEEFIYVLEGVVTVCIEDNQYTLYPGDCIQIHSTQLHNWANLSARAAKILQLNYPNPLKKNKNFFWKEETT